MMVMPRFVSPGDPDGVQLAPASSAAPDLQGMYPNELYNIRGAFRFGSS